MRCLITALILVIALPAAAQDDQKLEELIQRSLTMESPDPAQREAVEKQFRTAYAKLHDLCNCEPADIGDVLAKAWDEVRKAELKDGFLETVEMFQLTLDGVRSELDSAGAYTPSLEICQQYANLYVSARRESATMDDARKALVEMIHNLIGDEH